MCVCWSRASVCGSREPLAGDLQRHRPVGELPLLGQEDAGEGPPAQLLDQAEAGDRLPGLGERRCRGGRRVRAPWSSRRADQAVDVEHPAERASHLGEPREVLGGVGGLARLLAEAEFLVDQGDQGVVVEVGVAIAIPLDRHRLVRLPAQSEVGPEQRQQARPALRRASLGRKSPGSGRRSRVPRQAASNRRASRSRSRGRRLIPGLARGGQAQGNVPPGRRVMGGLSSGTGRPACHHDADISSGQGGILVGAAASRSVPSPAGRGDVSNGAVSR